MSRRTCGTEAAHSLTVDETAALLGVGQGTAYEGIRSGQIPHIKIGRRIIVPRAALMKLLEGAGVKAEALRHAA